jgi:hypothetical protein
MNFADSHWPIFQIHLPPIMQLLSAPCSHKEQADAMKGLVKLRQEIAQAVANTGHKVKVRTVWHWLVDVVKWSDGSIMRPHTATRATRSRHIVFSELGLLGSEATKGASIS